LLSNEFGAEFEAGNRARISAVVMDNPSSFSREGGGLKDGDDGGEDGVGLVVI
jgi:hypothetical protein